LFFSDDIIIVKGNNFGSNQQYMHSLHADLTTPGPVSTGGPIVSDRRYTWNASFNIHTTFA